MRMESLLPLLTRSINFIGDGGREAECILSEADRQRAAPQPHLQAETARLEAQYVALNPAALRRRLTDNEKKLARMCSLKMQTRRKEVAATG